MYNRGTSGKKKEEKLSVLYWWVSQKNSMFSPICLWWYGGNISEPHITYASGLGCISFTLWRSLHWLRGNLDNKSWDVRVHMKSPPYETSLILHLDTCFWTCAFHFKTRRLRNPSGCLEEEGKGKDWGWSFSSFRILEPALPWGQASLSYLRACFSAVLYLPRHLPRHREQLSSDNSHIQDKLLSAR